MSTIEMDPVVADALRARLVQHVRDGVTARRRRWVVGAAGVALVGGGVGVAVAQGVLTLPGADRVADLGGTVEVTRTGTATVDLGKPPAAATSVELTLTCLTAGTFTFADGASMICSTQDVAAGRGVALYTLPVKPGDPTTTIQADPSDARWTLTTTYTQHVPTDWATNAAGQTYGIVNEHGEPDLIAVVATNGVEGYVLRDEFHGPLPSSPEEALRWQAEDVGQTHTIGVYASDGTTRVGSFVVEGLARQGASAPQPAMPSPEP